MSASEIWILAELRTLRKTEEALKATYETLHGRGGPAGYSFLVSLKRLDERVNRLESFLEGVAERPPGSITRRVAKHSFSCLGATQPRKEEINCGNRIRRHLNPPRRH